MKRLTGFLAITCLLILGCPGGTTSQASSSARVLNPEWEQIALPYNSSHNMLHRTPVPGGWLLVAWKADANFVTSFVPDPEHAWGQNGPR